MKEAVVELQQQARMGIGRIGRITCQCEDQQSRIDKKDFARGPESVSEVDIIETASSRRWRYER
ncbi:hypothetical protein ANCCAN_11024 [Ancylostoma caninum]|uniref:Uncharacterized protein n=1 Tax=Ancylostoma caninum TaxID=29170 RepID=A0A368GF29_ANCCA|nr:hypothetical protein ANCCAN_11024 [Ancylostoma caninum]